MRVGIDARCLSRQLTGIGYYTLNVTAALDQQAIETVLFSPAPLCVNVSSYRYCKVVARSYRNLILRQIWSEFYLPCLLRRYELDVFWGPSHRLPFVLPAETAGVVTIHDVIWKVEPETMRMSTRLLETLFMPGSIKRADRIIADTRSTQDDIQQFFAISTQKIMTIPLAPRLSKYNISSKNNTPISKREKPYILFVGTLEPRKNLKRLIEAYLVLPDKLRLSYDLVIVGGQGWGETSYYQTLKEYPGSDTVYFMGYVTDDVLALLYRDATCLAVPSLYEGFGLPILEAQSFGVPVITSNISSMPEVVGDGGLLVDPDSVESIKNALESLLSNVELRNSLSQKAKDNSHRFSWNRTCQAIYLVFSEAMKLRNL